MKKIAGGVLAAIPLLVIMAGHVAQHGFVGALIGWGVGLGFVACLAGGIYLLVSD